MIADLIDLATVAGRLRHPAMREGRPLDMQMVYRADISSCKTYLRTLANVYPAPMARDRLAGEIGMTASGGTFGTYLSRLSAAGLIEKSVSGVRAAPALMEPIR